MNTCIKNGARSSKPGLLGVLLICLASEEASPALQAKDIRVPSGFIATIQQGVDVAKPGDTVIVLPGTYSGVYVGPDKSGLKILAAGAPGAVRIVAGSATGFLILGADNVRIQGFDISGVTDGITASAPRVSIVGNRIGNVGHAITLASWFVPCVDAEVSGNAIYGTVTGAIEVGGVRAHVHDNVMPDTTVVTGAGISLRPPSSECEVDHNILN